MYLQPRSLSGVFGQAASYLSRTWKRLTVLGLAVFTPSGALSYLTFRAFSSEDRRLADLFDRAAVEAMTPGALRDLVGSYLRAALVVMLIQLTASVFVISAAHRVVASEVSGRSLTAGQSARVALHLLPRAIAGAILALAPGAALVVAALAGMGTLSLPLLALAAWLLSATSMTTAATVVEGTGPGRSVLRSLRLVKGRHLATFGFLATIGGMGVVAVALIQLAAIPMVAGGAAPFATVFAAALGVVFQGVATGALGVPVTLWYLDLRARHGQVRIEDLV